MVKVILLIIFAAAVALLVIILPKIGKVPDAKARMAYAAKTEYFDGKRFTNERRGLPHLINKKDVRGTSLTPTDKILVVKQKAVEKGQSGKLYVTWLGHSSALIQLGEKNILIDPVFSKRISPVCFAGPKRFSEVPITCEDLPEIDILLISHNHYDHLDYETIKAIKDKVKHCIVPLGVENTLMGWGVSRDKISVLSWYDSVSLEGIEFTATPSQHFSMREPLHQNASWWCGYFFKDAFHSVYYTGDGGYCDGFKEISEKLGPIDLTLLECGQYGKAWPYMHMFPEESVEAAIDLQTRWVIPLHWGAYCICNNNWNDSIIRFTDRADEKGIKYATPLIGERLDYDSIAGFNRKWWEGLR